MAAEVPCGRVEAVRGGEVPDGTPNAEAEVPDAAEAEVPDDRPEAVAADAASDEQAAEVEAAAGPARYRRARLP